MHDKLLQGLAGLSVLVLSACSQAPATDSKQSFSTIKQAVGWVTSPAPGSLNTARRNHAAAVLASGAVLVTGGGSGSSTLDTAELYSSGTWTASTGTMTSPREVHTATKLSTGKVLLVGGLDGSGFTDTAELYDPFTDSFTAVASMNEARAGHTATLLPSGRVMIAGGTAYSSELTSVEVYDPVSNTWDYAPYGLNVPRSCHSATLLPSGEVLVAGGTSYGVTDGTAELCDPTTSPPTCTSTASLGFVQSCHTATLLSNGTVLLAGGYGMYDPPPYLPPPPAPQVWVDPPPYAITEAGAQLYSISGASWSPTGSMVGARAYATETKLSSGKVLVTGGELDIPPYNLDTAELYDPSTGTWTSTPTPMSASRTWHTASLLSSGNVLVTGGYDGSSDVSATDEFTP